MEKTPSLNGVYDSWMEQAFELAHKAHLQDEVPVGALVLINNQIVGMGYNQKENQKNPIAHAEVLAIQNAARKLNSWRLVGGILITTLEPCLLCLAACQHARLDRVIYGAQDPKGGALSLGYFFQKDPRLNHSFEVVYAAYEPCSQILSDFFAAKRKKQDLHASF